MKCSCGHEGAYEGLNSIECPNPACRHFSAQQAAAWEAYQANAAPAEQQRKRNVYEDRTPRVYDVSMLTVQAFDDAVRRLTLQAFELQSKFFAADDAAQRLGTALRDARDANDRALQRLRG